MACVSDDSYTPLPSTVSRCLPLGGQELQNMTDEPNSYDFLYSAYRLERGFPVYAMDIPNPDYDSVLASYVDHSGGADLIWDAVKQEAKLEAEKEPILNSFLYANILSHDRLEQALAFVLANRLQNPTLLATQLTEIFFDVMMHDKGIQRSIRLDLQAFIDWDPACLSYCFALLYMKGYCSLQVHRVAHALWGQGCQVLASALQSRVSEVFGVDIHSAAKIGEGILLDHGTGVVIGETAIIRKRVSLMHGVTLGGSMKEIGDPHPKIGDGVFIGASATILGNIGIGKGAIIAACSLLLKEVSPHSIVAGIPANVIGYLHELDPSLTMKHDATKDYFNHVAAHYRDGKSTS
ncbi:serine acetyltransferase 2-like [Prosopis cineraria]|uniref:serine acetyltransferase 2-like n=1 Tax=Prosopis cineraria TaxID=364024 RepID=UPI0024106EC3|nr:serine acetyltransferase 2-like [Prosopis cineraria]